jgi:hypothetical protein
LLQECISHRLTDAIARQQRSIARSIVLWRKMAATAAQEIPVAKHSPRGKFEGRRLPKSVVEIERDRNPPIYFMTRLTLQTRFRFYLFRAARNPFPPFVFAVCSFFAVSAGFYLVASSASFFFDPSAVTHSRECQHWKLSEGRNPKLHGSSCITDQGAHTHFEICLCINRFGQLFGVGHVYCKNNQTQIQKVDTNLRVATIVGRRSELRYPPYPFGQKSGTPLPFRKNLLLSKKSTKICKKITKIVKNRFKYVKTA